MIPATVTPATIQTLGLEALVFIRCSAFDMMGFREKGGRREGKRITKNTKQRGLKGFWKGFRGKVNDRREKLEFASVRCG